jgi:hypothetical protein
MAALDLRVHKPHLDECTAQDPALPPRGANHDPNSPRTKIFNPTPPVRPQFGPPALKRRARQDIAAGGKKVGAPAKLAVIAKRKNPSTAIGDGLLRRYILQ